MTKRKVRVYFVGNVPSPTLKIEALADIKIISANQLPSERFQASSILVIGDQVDTEKIIRTLPSVRTANPTLHVIGFAFGNLEFDGIVLNWMDEIIRDKQGWENFLRSRVVSVSESRQKMAKFLIKEVLLIQIMPIFLLVLAWHVWVKIFQPPPYVLPAPSRVIDAFLLQGVQFLHHSLVTASEALSGFFLGNVSGFLLAILLRRYLSVQTVALPALISLQAIPIVALAPLLSVWFGTGMASKIAMAAIICFFPMVVNVLQAFSKIDKEYQELFQMYRADFPKKLLRLMIPASTPQIVAALRISAGLSVVGAIVAEMTGSDTGLGYLILNGAYRLETDVLFVAILLSAILGLVFFRIPNLLMLAIPKSWRYGLDGN